MISYIYIYNIVCIYIYILICKSSIEEIIQGIENDSLKIIHLAELCIPLRPQEPQDDAKETKEPL